MAKQKLPPALEKHKFKPGQSGNPDGSRAQSPEERKLMKLTRIEVAGLLNKVSEATLLELQGQFNDPNVRAIEKLFIKIIIDGLKGDAIKSAEFILNRVIGKPKETVEHEGFKPAILVRRDGTELVFTNMPTKPDGEEE